MLTRFIRTLSALFLFVLLPLTLQAQNIRVNFHLLESAQVPESFHGYRILFLSDLHINALKEQEYFHSVVEKALSQKPYLILLGGDYVDDDTINLDEALELLRPLNSFPVYFVMGNHDNWLDRHLILEKMESMGFM